MRSGTSELEICKKVYGIRTAMDVNAPRNECLQKNASGAVLAEDIILLLFYGLRHGDI